MSAHPSSQELVLFLRGELPSPATRVVIGHLLKGCELCCARLEPRAEALLASAPAERPEGSGRAPFARHQELGEPDNGGGFAGLAEIGARGLAEIDSLAGLDPALDAAYDAAFERALAKARALSPAAAEAFAAPLAPAPAPANAPANAAGVISEALTAAGSAGTDLEACEALLERCRLLRHEDARELLELSARAVEAAERLRPAAHGAARVAALAALSWAERANAHRVAGELRQAEAAMAQAFDRAEEAGACGQQEGNADHSLLLAHLYDLQASLLGDQRRLDEALRLQDLVYDIRMQHGDLHGAGRALISKGVYTGYANDPEGALRLLAEGRQMIDAERDPQLVILGIQNTAGCLVALGRLEEAGALVREHRARYRQTAGRADRLRLLALAGWIDAGLGDLERAEQELQEAKGGLEALGFGYRSALVTLELAGVYLRQGRPAEARRSAEEAVGVFSNLGVGREALGALMLLKRAFDMGEAAAVIDRVADFMRRGALPRS